jgi:hypothetical protein
MPYPNIPISWRVRLKTLSFIPLALLAGLASSTAIAQTTTSYTSPIADYQKFSDEKVLPWKAANDKVGEIGGWRAYAREAQANANATPSTPATPLSTDVMGAEKIAKASMSVRIAWLHAVAKQEQVMYAKQMNTSALASSELAKRMRSVGNFTRLQQANQHALYAETATMLLTSTQEAAEAREMLIRAMGLNDSKASMLNLPDRLPDLPTEPIAESALKHIVRVSSTQMYSSEAPSELRSSYAAYRNSYDLAKHYSDEVLPLRKIISEETLLRYNGMFTSVFELLTDQREQAKAVIAAIAAKQAFWQAEAIFQDMLQTQLRQSSDSMSDK